MNKFGFEVMGLDGRWKRASFESNSYDEALEAMTTFVKDAWTRRRTHVIARICNK